MYSKKIDNTDKSQTGGINLDYEKYMKYGTNYHLYGGSKDPYLDKYLKYKEKYLRLKKKY